MTGMNKSVAFAAAVALALIALPVQSAKPTEVVAWSNGFPSGEHYNLNLHGKKEGYACETEPWGGSVFVPEYGSAAIDIVQNKRSDVSNLTVHDACGTFDGDGALVQLPAGEYQVYARIVAKPAKHGEPREVVFYPKLNAACDDSGTENFSTATDCDESFLLGTGTVTKDGAFDTDGTSLERTTDSESTKGKGGKGGSGGGKSTATDISAMFQWSGWACDQTYDTDGDGEITLADAPDMNGDNITDDADLRLYLETYCVYHGSTWVYDIADLVSYGWDYQNNGAKLVQIRFYPTDTTVFA